MVVIIAMHKHKMGNQARDYPKRKATNSNRMMIRESPIRIGHINKHKGGEGATDLQGRLWVAGIFSCQIACWIGRITSKGH